MVMGSVSFRDLNGTMTLSRDKGRLVRTALRELAFRWISARLGGARVGDSLPHSAPPRRVPGAQLVARTTLRLSTAGQRVAGAQKSIVTAVCHEASRKWKGRWSGGIAGERLSGERPHSGS